MPSKSKAQRRLMGAKHSRGEITDTQWEHFKKIEPGAPERKHPKKKGR